MSREAMKLAYEALRYASYEDTEYDDVCDQKVLEARRALRQALETEQEPVAWASSLDFDDDDQEIILAKAKGKLGTSNCDIPLYTAPQDADKAHALLRWVETEMRYAGWDTRLNDQHGRTDVYEAIKEFLA